MEAVLELALKSFWGLVVGAVFSTVGAAGGLLSSFGFISLFGIQNPNDVKLMSQLTVIATTLIFIPKYFKNSSLVWQLGLTVGISGVVGALSGSAFSSKYLSDMSVFLPAFGLLTLFISLQLYYKAYKAFIQEKRQAQENKHQDFEVKKVVVTLKQIKIKTGSKEYVIPTYSPALAGFLIAFVASVFGVGGGFLLVPYMNSLLKLPMKIIPGTVAIAVLLSTSFSAANYFQLGAELHSGVFIPVLAGALVGAYLGPSINKKLKNSYLQAILAVVITLIALKYLL